MQAKEAFQKVVEHCRWLGIPLKHKSKKQTMDLNGHKVLLSATINYYDEWETDYQGAFYICLRFDLEKKATWYRVAVLLHEIGHVCDYRNNMFMLDRKIIENEYAANEEAKRIADILDISLEKILHHHEKIIDNYKRVLPKEEI